LQFFELEVFGSDELVKLRPHTSWKLCRVVSIAAYETYEGAESARSSTSSFVVAFFFLQLIDAGSVIKRRPENDDRGDETEKNIKSGIHENPLPIQT